jgi:hypothetical protein
VAAIGATASPAVADWQIDTHTSVEAATGPPEQRSGRLIFDDTHLRMEFGPGPDLEAGPRTIVLFDSGAHALRAVDHARRSYVQLDSVEIAALAARVAATRKEMQAVLPQLPPDEQAAVRQMILDMSPAPNAPRSRERVVAQTETREIDDHEATLHDLMLDDRLVGEVWVAPGASFGLEPSDLAVFGAFSRFQADLVAQLGVAAANHFGGEPLALFERVDGVPLLVRRIAGGRVESETRFGPVEQVAADPARYEVPADYSRSSGPGGPS